MPSPFPGMDPYLENPRLWSGFHNRLIQFIARALNDVLPGGYFADTNERVYISEPWRSVLPDVAILEKSRPQSPPHAVSEGAAAVLDDPSVATDPPVYVTLGDAVREPYIEIFAVGAEDTIVTAIEVLSPANKTPGAGREQYVQKQNQIVNSATHFVEIDLLRMGAPTLFPLPRLGHDRQPADYAVCLHRAGCGGVFEVWPVTLRARLPRIPIPLAGNDPDTRLDLQAILHRAYDDGPYGKRIDYAGDPTPPFSPADAEWAGRLLRSAGLRPA